MLSFIQLFLNEEEAEIHKIDHDHIYSQKVDDHTIQSHFYKRDTKDGKKHYDHHFTHDNSFDRKSKADSAHKVKAIHGIIKHAKHFIKHEKPDSLTFSPNTKKKRDFSHNLVQHLAKNHKNSSVERKGNDISIKFH